MFDLELAPLSYGATNVGNLFRAVSDEQAQALLETAWECGVRYFDTAPHYGLGLSERRLGRFLADKPRDEYVLSTKVGRLIRPNPDGAGRTDDEGFDVPADQRRVWDFSEDGVRRSLEESLERLGLDRVDILYLHDPDEHDLQPSLATGVPAVARLREEGLVQAVGIGSKSTEALLAAARTGVLDVLMIAGRYTLLEQPALDDVIPECRAGDIAVVNVGVFNSGLLASPTPRQDSHYEYGAVPSRQLERARAIAAVCEEYGVDLPTAALQYSLREPTVRTVVVGGSRPEQIRQNTERMQTDVPEELWTRLAAEGFAP